jgi:hypothetical protein
MTGDAKFDLDAILGPDSNPDDRALLVAQLSAALGNGDGSQSPDVAQLAAYLDNGLTEDERLSVQRQLCASAAAQADVESATALLETVQNLAQRPSPAVMRQARDLMMAAVIQPKPQPTFWQRLSEPRVKIGLGFAFASLLAMITWNVKTGMVVTQVASTSATSNRDGNLSQEAITGATLGQTTTSTAAPSSQTWGAIALSSAGGGYGISHGAPTQELASAVAVTDCIARHGVNCRVAIAGQGQCFALASQPGGVPATAAAENYNDAQRKAIAACNAAQKDAAPCTIAKTFCSGR